MEPKEILIRCSSLGRIMGCIPKPLTNKQEKTFDAYEKRYKGEGKPLTNKQLMDFADLMASKDAKPKMNDAAKKYADQLAFDLFYNRNSSFSNKQMAKGNRNEELSTDLVSQFKRELLTTRTKRKKNEWLTGHCDIKTDDTIIDIKSTWDYTTFPLLDEKLKTKLYEWQIRGYMWLYDKPLGEVVYCLTNTPIDLIEDQIRRDNWNYDILDNEGNVRPEKINHVVQLVSNHIFDREYLERFCNQSSTIHIEWFKDFKEIPFRLRVKIYKFERNEESEKQIRICVELIQNYIKNKINDFNRTLQIGQENNNSAGGSASVPKSQPS